MSDIEAAPKPADEDVTPPKPSRWPALLIVCGVVASILWIAYLVWWLLGGLAAML